jgi:murein DD-endopeptidase MepM/ murein hydrolase activator NlpD
VNMNFNSAEYQHVYTNKDNVTNRLPVGGLEINIEKLRSDFTYPVLGKLISDYGMRRGRRHTGIDLKAAHEDTVRAAFPGVVRMSKLYSSYGNIVVIRHYNGLETVYSHNSKNLVVPDDVVYSGQPIALAGRTGRATTEHLHFEVRAAGEPIDPKLLIDPESMALRDGWLYIVDKNGLIMAAATESGAEHAAAKAEQTVAANEAAQAEAIAQSELKKVPPKTEPVYYIVKRGDVLGRIAQKHGTTVSKLCTLNSLKSPDRIREGQRLRIR